MQQQQLAQIKNLNDPYMHKKLLQGKARIGKNMEKPKNNVI